MILTKNVDITIMYKNIEYFKKLGYNVKNGDIIRIPVTDLMKKSKIKIKIKCDICGEESYQAYNSYIEYTSLDGLYYCQKCKSIKTKKTFLKRYGVKHALQNEEFEKKRKNTMLERYGVENSAHSHELIEKAKETRLKKYGVEYYFQTDEFIEKAKKSKKKKYGNYNNYNKIKQTKIEKYNDANYNNRKKCAKTCQERYGVENVSQNEEIKEKKIQTCLKNWGVEHSMQSEIIMNKKIKTCKKRYGVPHAIMADNIKEKAFSTNVKNKRWTKRTQKSDFERYHKLVDNYTRKNKNLLIENWDGFDYYTGEYIKDNLNLDSNDKNYPTIDHKKSIKYGFNNSILPEIIADIDNLCVTTRSNNSSKKIKTDEQFKHQIL